MPINIKEVFNNLKLLPAITFALMLGAGVVVTAFAVWFGFMIGHGHWPADVSVATARINALAVALDISLALIGLVIVALAFGKIKNLAVTAPNGIGANIAFDDTPEGKSVTITEDTTTTP